MVRIVHHKFGGTSLHCACYHGIYLVGKQMPPLLKLIISPDNLLPGHNATCSFKIGGKKKFHTPDTPQLKSCRSRPTCCTTNIDARLSSSALWILLSHCF